jgi:hypothetical protein
VAAPREVYRYNGVARNHNAVPQRRLSPRSYCLGGPDRREHNALRSCQSQEEPAIMGGVRRWTGPHPYKRPAMVACDFITTEEGRDRGIRDDLIVGRRVRECSVESVPCYYAKTSLSNAQAKQLKY